jgi:hypothetical protein
MRIIDVHSHFGTRRGHPLRSEQELAHQRATWNSSLFGDNDPSLLLRAPQPLARGGLCGPILDKIF